MKNMPEFNKVSKQLLQAMPYQYVGNNINVCIETDEFTCLCPWTGLPDFAHLKIQYVPNKVVVELKSLKMYLQSYRMVGMVHESVVNSIIKDITLSQFLWKSMKFVIHSIEYLLQRLK